MAKDTEKITVTFNGVTATGTIKALEEFYGGKINLQKGYYHSASKGTVPIRKMASMHIKNAILKRYREWLESDVKNAETPQEFVQLLGEGFNTPEILALWDELKLRNRRGYLWSCRGR